MSETETPTVKATSLFPTYSIVTLVVTGLLAVCSLIFVIIIGVKSKTLDDEDQDDIKEPPRISKGSPTDSVVPVTQQDTTDPVTDTTTPAPTAATAAPVTETSSQDTTSPEPVPDNTTTGTTSGPVEDQ